MRCDMELSTLKKIFNMAIASGWEEILGMQEVVDGTGFKIMKTLGSGKIYLTCNSWGIMVETDKYFSDELKEEKENNCYGGYSFLEGEARDLLNYFKNTLEIKRMMIYDNILGLLEKGRRIVVLNPERKRKLSGNKEKYLYNKITEALKNKEKRAYFQIVY